MENLDRPFAKRATLSEKRLKQIGRELASRNFYLSGGQKSKRLSVRQILKKLKKDFAETHQTKVSAFRYSKPRLKRAVKKLPINVR